jgi:hypothetical protein
LKSVGREALLQSRYEGGPAIFAIGRIISFLASDNPRSLTRSNKGKKRAIFQKGNVVELWPLRTWMELGPDRETVGFCSYRN